MRCKMRSEARCVLCDEGVVEDIKHFSIGCVEFEGGRREMVEKIGGIVGAEEWNGVEEMEESSCYWGRRWKGLMVRWECG